MGQILPEILHTDIWPLLTSAEVNIRVAYEQKENLPIPKYITWNNSITKHSHIHLNNHVKYASWNKWVLVRDLKMSRDGDRLMLRGRSFHSIGAVAAKDLLPKFSNRHRGDVSWWFSLDRRECALGRTEQAVHVGKQVRVHSEPCK